MKKIILTINFIIQFSLFTSSQVFPSDKQQREQYMSEIYNLKFNSYSCSFNEDIYLSIDKGIIPYDFLIDETPLIHLSCLCGNLKLVQKLSNKDKVDLNILNKNGTTPLMFALFNGNEKVIRYLLNKKVLLGKKNNFSEDEIQFLIEGKSDNIELLNLILSDKTLPKMDNEYFTELLISSIINHKNNFYDYLLTLYDKSKISSPNDIGRFISTAIASGNLFVAEKILSNYSQEQISFDEPLINQVCIKANFYNLFTRIHNEDKIQKDDSLDVKLLNLVLQSTKINLDEVLIEGEDILFNVKDNHPVIKFIIAKKKFINNLNIENKTFLQYFIDKIIISDLINFNNKLYSVKELDRDYREDFNMVKYLIEHNATVNKEYKNGWIYLILESLTNKKPLIVEKLLASEPIVFIKDKKGKSTIDYVLEYSDETNRVILKQLLEKVGRSKN